jgi:hypothetical protein
LFSKFVQALSIHVGEVSKNFDVYSRVNERTCGPNIRDSCCAEWGVMISQTVFYGEVVMVEG